MGVRFVQQVGFKPGVRE